MPPAPHTLAHYVGIVARGPGKSRSLTQGEAREVMALILAGEAAPEAIGALLMVLRVRHETADEIAGFAEAARASLGGWQEISADLDWPSYAAGRSRGLPYFLLAATLLAKCGVRVLMHGYNSHMRDDGGTMAALEALGLSSSATPMSARADLARNGFAYVPLAAMSSRLLDLLKLRQVLGLRSCINSVLRALNPAGAGASLVGVFHPPYIALQVEAAQLMGQQQLAVFKGGGGEAERTPFKDLPIIELVSGTAIKTEWSALIPGQHRRLHEDGPLDVAHLLGLWRGEISDEPGEAIVIGTAAVALSMLQRASSPSNADKLARSLWSQRDRGLLPFARKAA